MRFRISNIDPYFWTVLTDRAHPKADTQLTLTTRGIFQLPSSIEGDVSFGQYIRNIGRNSRFGAGSQLDSLSASERSRANCAKNDRNQEQHNSNQEDDTGGYLAARLRIRDHIPGPETKFRDGAHGFMVWVIGVALMIAVLLGTAALSAHTGANPSQVISEEARKAVAYFSFWSFLALLFGAVAATLAGILGGELRDER